MTELTGAFRVKRGTSAEWASSTVPLGEGEWGYDLTLKRVKMGDGATLWPALKWHDTDPAVIARIEEVADAIDGALGADDAVIAANIADTGSATRTQLNTASDDRVKYAAENPGSAAGAALRTAFSGQARPRGRRVILHGDSITAYNGGTSTATPTQALAGFSSLGMWRWANIFSGQAVDIIGNSGIGGQESSQIRARFSTDVLAYTPDIVSILAGTNDDGPEDQTQQNLQTMYETALQAGIFVIAFTIPPQTNGDLGTYRQGVNTWIRSYVASHAGMALVDLASIWQDKTQSGFKGRTDYLPDGTHPNTLGAQVAGLEVAKLLGVLLPVRTVQDANIARAPFNLLSNPRFAGSGTTAPTGWSVTGAGVNVTYIARGDGKPGQLLAVTVPNGGSGAVTANVPVGANLRVDDEYDFTVTIDPYDLEVTGTPEQRINVRTQEYSGSAFSQHRDAIYSDANPQYSSARFPAARGVFRTQKGKFTSGKTLMQVVVSLAGGGTYVLSDPVARNLTMLAEGTVPTPPAHTNLITNGKFETDASGWSGGASAVVARVTTDAHSGGACLQVTHTASVNSDARTSHLTIDRTKPLPYSVWVKAPSGFGGRVYFHWHDEANTFLSNTNVSFTGTGAWQEIAGTVNTIPASTAKVIFSVGRADGTGTPVVLIDDADVWQD